MAFVHLHNHSDCSIDDGATPVESLVQRAVDLKAFFLIFPIVVSLR